MGEHHALTQSQLVPDLHFLGETGETFNAYPLAHLALPGYDAIVDVGAFSDHRVSNYCALFQSASLFYSAIRPNHHIWPYLTTFLDYARRINQDVSNIVLRSFNLVVCEVGPLSHHIISWLSNIKPKVILQGETVKTAFLSQLREDLLLNHAETLRDAV